ncbi:hypothetical protein VTN77DRAFT_4281 [Rasamsonia byssochlamydoides]|uniref:uncharacterized protein n=1 Tax=Rasamsonia byssochlamydoides TaxID=89139 RepID=UPI003742DEB5
MSVRSTLGILSLLLIIVALEASAHPVSIHFRADQSDSQDESNLPLQIGGIVGSYVIFDALVVVLLLLVGRRLRGAVQSSNYTLDMIMLQPVNNKPTVSTDPSPISAASTVLPSPDKARGWNMSWSNIPRGSKTHASNNSVATIDESVVSADRRKAQEDLEMLYAAVMEHDARKAAGADQSSPVGSPLHSPRGFSQYQTPPSPRPEEKKARSNSRLSKISNLSIFSPGLKSPSSISNKLRSPRLSIRKLPISPPAEATSYGENQPLTPRVYNPGPPPTAPLAPTQSNQTFKLQPINPGSSSSNNNNNQGSRAAAPTPLNLNNRAANSSSTLPFRQFNPPQSAPPTKTTILERPARSTDAPRTGVPTPYSPYMPFTPVTPITPSRMVTKREKRRQEKINGLRVLQEDDMVKSDEELWGL